MPSCEISHADVVFDPATREMCVTPAFHCPHYGHSWACPPAAPYMEETLREYARLFVVWAGTDLAARLEEARRARPGWSEERRRARVHATVDEELKAAFQREVKALLARPEVAGRPTRVLWCGGSCDVCANPADGGCTYDAGEPCRYPDRCRYSMEAVGIRVSETLATCGVDLEWPPVRQVVRAGMVCVGTRAGAVKEGENAEKKENEKEEVEREARGA